ncbi:MAG: serine/threonine protein kinase, partial [Candidatus Competibacteraceae bacterium]
MEVLNMSVICPVCASENPEVAVACGVCGHRFIAPDPALPAGATLDGGRYTIERVLGRGGFGITYRARSRHRPVAIKEFFPVDRDLCGRAPGSCNLRPGREWEHFELQLRRFLDEANRLHELHHEHIVPLRDHFEENGTAYLVLDLIDGDSLAERVGRARYRPDEARALLEPLIGALEYLHGKSLAHLDVKPHNILVKSDGAPVLIDFGLARDYLSAKTRSIMLDASDGYAAIEQYSADLPRGPWTDVYALGATLYFMLAGEIPPNAPALLDGRQLVFSAGFDAGLRETIEAAMRPRAMERLRDLAAFRAVLAGSVASGGTVRRKDRRSDDCQEPIAFAHHFVDTCLFGARGIMVLDIAELGC